MNIQRYTINNFNHHFQRLLILLLITIGNVGKYSDDSCYYGVSAHDVDDAATGGKGYYEQVLYSNPQFYSLQNNIAVGDSSSLSEAEEPKAEEVVGLLFNIRSKLAEEDEADTIYITGFEFYTSITGTIYYQLFSREGPYYDTPEGANGGVGISDWDPLVDDDEVAGGLGEGTGFCDLDMLKMEYREKLELGGGDGGSSSSSSSLFGENDGIDASDMAMKSGSIGAPSCPLSSVPENKFSISSFSSSEGQPWTLKGPNATRSFYLTLASKNLLAHPRNIAPGINITENPPSFDSVVVASNADLEIYEGVAARTYPLDLDTEHYYHTLPMGFIGKIHYHVEGREPSVALSPAPSISTLPLESGMTQAPIESGTTQAPTESATTASPTVAGQTRAPVVPGDPTIFPTGSPTLTPTKAETQPPTPRPTRRCRPGRPCLLPPPPPAPPTASPTPAPPQLLTVELMGYVENVPERKMSDREQDEYVDILLKYLGANGELGRNGLEVRDLTVFWQDVYVPEEKKRRKRKGGLGSGNADGKNESDSFTYHYNNPESQVFEPETKDYSKGYSTVYVMTKVEVFTKLPFDVAAFFVWDQLRDGEKELIGRYKANSIFVTYFREMTGISFEVVDDLSRPPTPSPTFPKDEDAAAAAAEAAEAEVKAAEKRNIYTWVGIIICILWILLMFCGFNQIFKHRRKAYERTELDKTRMLKRRQSMYTPKKSRRLSFVFEFLNLPGMNIGNTFDSRGGLHDDALGKSKKKSNSMRRSGFLSSSRGGLDGAELADLVSDQDSSTAEATSRRSPKRNSGKKKKKKTRVPEGSKRVSFADHDFDRGGID